MDEKSKNMVIIILENSLKFKNKEIPRIILGSATFTAESHFGHRSRLYQLDLHEKVEEIVKIIKKACELGIAGINLTNDENLIKAFKIANCENNKDMKVIATVGKSNVDRLFPNFEEAKKADWKGDIERFSKFNTPVMLVDEFITDSYDWELLKEIIAKIKEKEAIAGLITSFPFKTTRALIDSPIIDLFDFYMIPINKFGYMMDTESFLDKERNELAILLKELDKKVIASKILSCGIQTPNEAFDFLKTLDYVDMLTFSVANEKELIVDSKLFKKN